MHRLCAGAAALAAVPALPSRLLAHSSRLPGDLPRSAPEAQGVDSGAILEFLAAWSGSSEVYRTEPHSFMLVRHGHVVAEGWWAPYRPRSIHLLHSLSKSFTCTAVGFAVAEGMLEVQDSVADLFPDLLPPEASANLRALQVRDLLTMSVGRASEAYSSIMNEDDWVKAFLALPIESPPGSTFSYDNWASYMLSAVIQRISGQNIAEYLRPRFFDPLDAREIDWEIGPRGINTGGWGLSATTETIAKFGQFYLQGGTWNHRRLLPMRWIDEATSFKIQQPPTWGPAADPGALSDPTAALDRLRKTNDWYQGYCYQFWRCRHNAYRGDGAFGQFCIVMPDLDAVIVLTGETGDMQGVLDLVWDHVLPAMHHAPLAADEKKAARLSRTLASLALPPPRRGATAPIAGALAGRRFSLEPNSMGAESASFEFRGRSCVFELKTAEKSSEIHCGMGGWIDGVTDMPGTPPLAPWDDFRMRDRLPVKVAAACAWRDGHTLQMQWRYYEKGNRDTVNCRFDGDHIKIEFLNSITPLMASHPEIRPVLVGRSAA